MVPLRLLHLFQFVFSFVVELKNMGIMFVLISDGTSFITKLFLRASVLLYLEDQLVYLLSTSAHLTFLASRGHLQTVQLFL